MLSAFVTPQGSGIDPTVNTAPKANQLLRVAIALGDLVVPEGYVHHLINTYPILQMADITDGRLPLHNAALAMSRQIDFNGQLLRNEAESETKQMVDSTMQFDKERQQEILVNHQEHEVLMNTPPL